MSLQPDPASAPRDLRLLRSLARRIDPTDAGAHNNLGVLYYNAGLYDDAAVAFMRALELDPRMEIAQRNFEVACVNSGRAEERMSALREHLRAHPNDRDRRWVLARISALLGDHTEAIAQLNELLKEQPRDVRALIQLGLCHKAVDAAEAAHAAYTRALEIDPNSSLLYFHLAEIEYHRGQNDRALELLRAAIDRNAENYEAWYLLGFVLGDMGRLEEAQDAAKRALELNPDLGRAQANLAVAATPMATYVDKARRDAARSEQPDATPNAPLTHVTLGLAFRNRGYYAEALDQYQQALERGEDIDVVQQAMAELCLLRRHAAQALRVYDALLERHPRHPKLWNERGVALHQAGRSAEALESYERALSLDGAYAFALNNCGVARYNAGDHDGARDMFARAIAANPRLTPALLNHALLLYKSKRVPQAIEAYRAVLDAGDGTHPVAWNGIGLILAELGKLEEARTAYARAVHARPDYAEAHYNLSFVLTTLGDVEGAIRENKLALEIQPYYTQQRFELAVDFELGAPDLAIEPDVQEERTDAPVTDFAFDAGVLDSLFGELSPSVAAKETADRAEADAYAMAEDFLSKGFLDRAQSEALRVMRRGADPARGATLLGDVFARQRLWGEALERYQEARRTAPDSLPAMTGEATALLRLGRGAQSREVAEAVLARVPDSVDTLMLVAEAREASDDARAALVALNRARQLAPGRADVHARFGHASAKLEDTTGAIAAYRKALEIDPRFLDAHLALAHLYMETLAFGDAERELSAALEVDRTHADATVMLSMLRRLSGRAREALQLLVAFIERDLYCFPALMALGETLLALEKPSDALVAFNRVLRLDPGHLGARRAIRDITSAKPQRAAASRGRGA